jgi:hypothetical protein
MLGTLLSCTTVAPSIAFSGLPAFIVKLSQHVLTATGSPGSSAGLWIYTFSSTCGGSFSPASIGPTNATAVTTTWTAPGTGGPCTVMVTLTTASGRTATASQTPRIADHGVDDNLVECPTAVYTTINAAVTAATPGETILVCPGTYNENVIINKSLTLLGAKAGIDARTRGGSLTGETVINSNFAGGTIQVQANNVTIDGVAITNAVYGIIASPPAVTPASNVVVQNVYIASASQDGVILYNATSGTVRQNLIKNTVNTGISGGSSDSMPHVVLTATIEDNEIVNARYGISGYQTGSTIRRNYVHSFTGSPGAGIGGQFTNTTIQGNTVSGYTNGAGIGFAAYPGRPLSSNVSVTGNRLTGNAAGVYVDSTQTTLTGIVVNSNNITGNTTAGAFNLSTATLNAENNWWGCAAGPGNPGCDTVVGNVDFTPWLTAPVP